MFVKVRNCVTTSATRPGIAERGIMKLKLVAITTDMDGRKYWKKYFLVSRFNSKFSPKSTPFRIAFDTFFRKGCILIVKPSASYSILCFVGELSE